MADNLPLIPQKDRVVCSEIRCVLREVFRGQDWSPSLTNQHSPSGASWNNEFSLQHEDLRQKEKQLKDEHAKRISRKSPLNIYRITSLDDVRTEASWKTRHKIITRKDLIPGLEVDAGRDTNLLVKNILNSSSCDVSCVEKRSFPLQQPLQMTSFDYESVQSLSIGEAGARRPALPPIVPKPPPRPECILCVPRRLDFVNFVIGRSHSQSFRIVNVSKNEVRLSIRPPKRRELYLTYGPRGLVITSGAAADMRVTFIPQDLRAIEDSMLVRVSTGPSVVLPIWCHMEPPILDVIVPNLRWWSLSCSEGEVFRGCENGGQGEILDLGARLLGDVHSERLLLNSAASHAAFFLLTEDAWLSFIIDDVTRSGAVLAGPFGVWPVWWAGGGPVAGGAWCRAPHAGLHAAALRVLASTAVHRPLHIVADAVHFSPSHVTLEAHDKDYDICSDDDPACEYYVHLGTSFPHRALCAPVRVVNHSPVIYSYYWSVRPWGYCSCWEDGRGPDHRMGSAESSDEQLCDGAILASQRENQQSVAADEEDPSSLVRAQPASGSVGARSSCTVHVCVPQAARAPGVWRTVLMLILKDIPKESFRPDFDPMVIKTETIQVPPLPGLKSFSREVCDVVCCQLEVWWEVVPIRFVLDPPVLQLSHSRRVKHVDVTFRVTQLWGTEDLNARWRAPSRLPARPAAALRLTLGSSTNDPFRVTLPALPDHKPDTDVFVLEDVDGVCRAESRLVRQCVRRHPRLKPSRAWLGVVAPGDQLCTQFKICNKTYQQVQWISRVWPWVGKVDQGNKCANEQHCCCARVHPFSGDTPHGGGDLLHFQDNTLMQDGCVLTLVQLVGSASTGAGVESRSSVVAYRVLAPRLTLRVLPCFGDKAHDCEGCGLDATDASSSVLRPSAALTVGRCSCYRLRLTNTTPIPTTVVWEPPPDLDEYIKVTFLPNDFDVGSYARVEIRMVIEARRVCSRRVFVRRARVSRAYKPLYLLIDTAVAGLSITYEIPLGGGERSEGSLTVRHTQQEEILWKPANERSLSADDIFQEEDRKRTLQAENFCHCRYEMAYLPEMNPPLPNPPADDPPLPAQFVADTLLLLGRECECCTLPHLPPQPSAPPAFRAPLPLEPPCVQYRQLPLRTVWSRTILVRNESVLPARWAAAVRLWPRRRKRTFDSDRWPSGVHDAGIALQVTPSGGTLGPRAVLYLTLSVYATCWGLYHDQLHVTVSGVRPLVVDLWVEVCGPPLQLALKPHLTGDTTSDEPTLWISRSDGKRAVRVRNTSRTELTVQAYLLHEHAQPRVKLPFRLYLRLFDVPRPSPPPPPPPPVNCTCHAAIESEHWIGEEQSRSSSIPECVDIGVELFLAADYGPQEDSFFDVEPAVASIGPDLCAEFYVSWRRVEADEVAPDAVLMLRTLPVHFAGPGWYRGEPPPLRARIREAQRTGGLQVSESKVHARYCALALPSGEIMRIRKRLSVRNVGNAALAVEAAAGGAWTIVTGDGGGTAHFCGAGCVCARATRQRNNAVQLNLPPNSSSEICVEASVVTADVWPSGEDSPREPPYPQLSRTVADLRFYNTRNILLSVPLILELEFPILTVEPLSIDFGFVTNGDTRKTYFTVCHSSPTETLDLISEWKGASEFQIWPLTLRLPPNTSLPVYVQYTAKWVHGLAAGRALVATCGAGGAWCRAAVRCRAAPARDQRCHLSKYDHTDDKHLLPPDMHFA